jgi:hypothetical protein
MKRPVQIQCVRSSFRRKQNLKEWFNHVCSDYSSDIASVSRYFSLWQCYNAFLKESYFLYKNSIHRHQFVYVGTLDDTIQFFYVGTLHDTIQFSYVRSLDYKLKGTMMLKSRSELHRHQSVSDCDWECKLKHALVCVSGEQKVSECRRRSNFVIW